MLGYDPKHETFVTVIVLAKENEARAGSGRLCIAGNLVQLCMGTLLLYVDLTLQTLLASRKQEDLMCYML